MKKILSAATGLLFLLASCNDAANNDNGANMNTQSNQAKMNSENTRDVYRALETGDVNKLDSFIAEDFIDHDNSGKDRVGRDSLKALIGDVHNHFDNLKFNLISEGTSPDDNYHFALVKMSGTAKDNMMGMPAGTKVESTSVDVVKIKNGKAVEHWSFEDPKEMMDMMKSGMKDKMPGNMKENKMDSAKKM